MTQWTDCVHYRIDESNTYKGKDRDNDPMKTLIIAVFGVALAASAAWSAFLVFELCRVIGLVIRLVFI
jgi:hypothetical protein